MNYSEAKNLFEHTRKRKLANNTYLVKTVQGYGVKLYDTVVIEFLDDHRVKFSTGGWRTTTTFNRWRRFSGVNIYKAGFRSYISIPDGTVIDKRDLFIEYPEHTENKGTFEYVEMGKDFKPVKTLQINKAKLSSECWSVQFRGFEACKNCEFKGTEDCGGQNILKTGKNENGCVITKERGIA